MWERNKILLVLIALATSCNSEQDITPTPRINPDYEQNIPGWFYSYQLKSNRYIYVNLPEIY